MERLYAYQQEKEKKLEAIRREEKAQMFKPHINENSQKISSQKKNEEVLLKKLVQTTDKVDYYEAQPPSVKKGLYTNQKSPSTTKKTRQTEDRSNSRKPQSSTKKANHSHQASKITSRYKDHASARKNSPSKSAERSHSRSRSAARNTEKKHSVRISEGLGAKSLKKTHTHSKQTPNKRSHHSRSRSHSRGSRTNHGLPIKSSQKKSPYSKSK